MINNYYLLTMQDFHVEKCLQCMLYACNASYREGYRIGYTRRWRSTCMACGDHCVVFDCANYKEKKIVLPRASWNSAVGGGGGGFFFTPQPHF